METPKVCRYCGSEVVFTSNAEIYGKEYGNGKCYLCRNCRAFVGVHTGTKTPLGSLANAELKEYRKRAHLYFDRLWQKPLRIFSRANAYKILSEKLNKSPSETHIGMFEKDECEKTIEISEQIMKDYRKERNYGKRYNKNKKNS